MEKLKPLGADPSQRNAQTWHDRAVVEIGEDRHQFQSARRVDDLLKEVLLHRHLARDQWLPKPDFACRWSLRRHTSAAPCALSPAARHRRKRIRQQTRASLPRRRAAWSSAPAFA